MTNPVDLEALVRLIGPDSRPNLNPLMMKLRNLDALALSVKYFGYELAHSLAQSLPVRSGLFPRHVGLRSKPSTQADLESEWAAVWLQELKLPFVYHRKLWEFAYVLQAIWEHGSLRENARGLGFGCGMEPLPSYLAARGVDVTVTDLEPQQSAAAGWLRTAQHAATLDHAYKADLVDRATFDRRARLEFVDMTAIPKHLQDYDFCWSICAFEHLGSIAAGLDFIANSLATLRPGGLSVHTTEFNFLDDRQTIDNWPTVLFQKRHFAAIAERLRAAGHQVAELDFDVGMKPLDRFVDVPPWAHDMSDYMKGTWGTHTAHLKLAIDGFVSTCFGLVIVKAE
ncbi:class I SAM-dependent methyltransferase [Siculibacillus lacustris]|uniref:Class I SAM-dependent methyltransferase n=1 Tax=Siculibacillus lacustris TaxID=1549641 RepID=A0A4Q9VV10_9HYPH|nr:class I SAM-dependent methyltransferase [Siculibacillus lacustris]TBW39536.1 class I SAM-dependent methyltransferase [Siculibacillus lacustris]